MLIGSWNREGLIYWDLIEQGRTVNAEVCCEQLELCRREIGRRRCPVILLQDNACPRVARRTQTKLRSARWECLEHSSCSPDLSP